jgi:glutamine synthetase
MEGSSKPGTGRPSSEIEVLRQELAQRGVKYMLSSYVDMHGVPKGKMVPLEHLPQMLAGSELYTGAALDGVPQEVSDEEVSSHPDPNSWIQLPWRPDVAWFASDLWTGGKPFEACSRTILTRQMERAAAHGWIPQLGMEAEFFVLQDTPDGGFRPVSTRTRLDKSAYDAVRLVENLTWMDELVSTMNALGWDVYSFDHEDGIGQFEIDFAYADMRTMADRYVFFRMMAHEIARKHGYFASFMPKPYPDRAGSGSHFNMSFKEAGTGRNLFFDAADRRGCKFSQLGYHYIGGLLRHMGAICAVTAPTVNSYKRLILRGSASGFTWAPVFVCYGNNNRTNTLRIPLAGGRVELRATDSACNPYLGAALVLAAGLEGIEQRIDPGEPHTDNMYVKSEAELKALGVGYLPRSLGEALDAFEVDPLTRQVFGESMHRAWLDYKREEWMSYNYHITDWEKSRYLKMF